MDVPRWPLARRFAAGYLGLLLACGVMLAGAQEDRAYFGAAFLVACSLSDYPVLRLLQGANA